MILVPTPLSSYKYNEPVSYSKFSLGVPITPIFLQWEWCHLPLLQRLQLMLPQLVLIEQAVSRLFSKCKCCGKGNCKKAAVGSKGDHWQQGGTRYGCDIWSGGTDYSAMDSLGDHCRGGTVHGMTVRGHMVAGSEKRANFAQILFFGFKTLIALKP